MIRFDGRVAIVTGAGRGLGRAHALLLASRGAKVLVNDLGKKSFVSHDSDKGSESVADSVVAEILAAGGEAVSNTDSVEDGGKIVQACVKAFGKVDIVVCNAGVAAGGPVDRVSKEVWEHQLSVHVLGAYTVVKAAWPIMKAQRYGRIVLTSSPAGLYGLMYTTPYSAAKAALIGFSNALTLEGTQYGIASNTIAPYAATRMTTPGANRKNADPGKAARYAATLAMMDPGHVSALVAFLCHQDCKEEGGVFEAGAGWFAKVRTQRAPGAFLPGPPAADLLERLRDEWSKVTDFDGAQEVGPGTVKTGFEPVSMMKLQGKL